jgi:hypothetical protein
MSTEYQLRIYNRTGTLKAVVVDFLRLAYRHQRNAPGMLEFAINPTHAAVNELEIDGLVEVWRRTENLPWYVEFSGLYRWQQQGLDQDGKHWLTVRCPGLLHLVQRSIVAYAKNTNNRAAFVQQKAETIIKNIVKYNATSAGTVADGRLRNVQIGGVQVEADASRGETLDFECSLQNSLTAIQRVADIGGGDFVMTKEAAALYEFGWRAPNEVDDLVFAPNFGNVTLPVLTRNWLDTKTIAITGNADGVFQNVQLGDIADYLDAELHMHAPNTTEDGLSAAGQAALAGQVVDQLSFQIIQTPTCAYAVHYAFLDWITVSFAGVTRLTQIREVGVTVDSNGQETIEVVCRD